MESPATATILMPASTSTHPLDLAITQDPSRKTEVIVRVIVKYQLQDLLVNAIIWKQVQKFSQGNILKK